MGVEAKGFSAAQNKAAVRGVSGVQGSPIDQKKQSTAQQVTKCFGLMQQAGRRISRRSRHCTQTGMDTLDSSWDWGPGRSDRPGWLARCARRLL